MATIPIDGPEGRRRSGRYSVRVRRGVAATHCIRSRAILSGTSCPPSTSWNTTSYPRLRSSGTMRRLHRSIGKIASVLVLQSRAGPKVDARSPTTALDAEPMARAWCRSLGVVIRSSIIGRPATTVPCPSRSDRANVRERLPRELALPPEEADMTGRTSGPRCRRTSQVSHQGCTTRQCLI